MSRFVFRHVAGQRTWDISELDAAGMGRQYLSLAFHQPTTLEEGEVAACLLSTALALEGGLVRALELLRAEAARQRQGQRVRVAEAERE